jgi:hypothetical protein
VSVVGAAINWAKVRRNGVSNASWIADRAALQKSLQLCSGCRYTMPHRWQARFHYAEFTLYHGDGTCDGCRHLDTITLFLSTDDPWFAACEAQARAAAQIQAHDQALAVTDRRRVL